MFTGRKFKAFLKQYEEDYMGLVHQYHELEDRFNELKAEFDGDVKEKLDAEKDAAQKFSQSVDDIFGFSYEKALKSGEKN